MKPLLSILIPVTPDRSMYLARLVNELSRQIQDVKTAEVEILIYCESYCISIGAKRNWLLNNANGEFVAFIDSDDMPTPKYISSVVEAIKSFPTCSCVELRGLITEDGQNPDIFAHSMEFGEWRTNNDEDTRKTGIRHERYPNHLNAIRADIAKKFQFPEKNHGEDHDWSTKVFRSGLLVEQAPNPVIIYEYRYQSNK